MAGSFYLTKQEHKPRQISIEDEDERIISAWASVEVKDKQGELIPIEELVKIMPKVMDRGGLVMFKHSNKPVGKILGWEVSEHPETGKKGLKLLIKIFDHYKLDDEVWKMIKDGTLKGISFGGASSKQEVINWEKGEDIVRVLRDIEGYEFSIVENPANPFATIEEVNFLAKGDTEKAGKFRVVIYKYRGLEDSFERGKEWFFSQLHRRGIKFDYKEHHDLVAIDIEGGEAEKKVVMDLIRKLQLDGVAASLIEEDRNLRLGDVEVEKYIRRKGNKWVVVDHEGNILGEHDTKEEALRQLRAIEANKEDTEKLYVCDVCGREFENEKELQEHREKEHGARSMEDAVKEAISLTERMIETVKWLESLGDEERAVALEMIAKEYEEIAKPGDKRPPKEWWDRCIRAVRSVTDTPERLCGWIFYHHLKPTTPKGDTEKAWYGISEGDRVVFRTEDGKEKEGVVVGYEDDYFIIESDGKKYRAYKTNVHKKGDTEKQREPGKLADLVVASLGDKAFSMSRQQLVGWIMAKYGVDEDTAGEAAMEVKRRGYIELSKQFGPEEKAMLKLLVDRGSIVVDYGSKLYGTAKKLESMGLARMRKKGVTEAEWIVEPTPKGRMVLEAQKEVVLKEELVEISLLARELVELAKKEDKATRAARARKRAWLRSKR